MSSFVFAEYRISALFLLAYVFFFSIRRYNKRKSLGILLLCYLVTGILDWQDIYVMKRTGYSMPVMLIEIILVQGTSLLFFAYRDFRALFTGITASCYVLFGNALCGMVYIHTGSFAAGIATQAVVHSLILGLLFLTVRKEYLWELENTKKNWNWGVLCLIPLLFYCIVVSLIAWPESYYEETKNKLSTILVLVLMTAVYVIIAAVFYQRRKEQELVHDVDLLQNHAKKLKDELQTTQEKDMKLAIIRHDFHHYVNLMRVYLESDETEKLRQMLMAVEKELEQTASKRYCENRAVNGVISKWDRRAQKNGIRFNYYLDVPESLRSDSFEMEFVVVVSNLLENAVLAAAAAKDGGGERFVDVRIMRRREKLLLELVNSFSGEYRMDEERRFPVSEQGKDHGYGLRSVTSFAKKRNAVFDYSIEGNMFVVRLLV